MQIVTPKTQLLLIAADVKVNILDGGSLRLFQNDITPTLNTVVGDLTIATFSGYANKTITTWVDPYVDSSGNVVSLAGLETFTCSGAGTSNLIYGAYYLNAGGDLVWAGRFDGAPIGMASASDALPFVPRYMFGNLG